MKKVFLENIFIGYLVEQEKNNAANTVLVKLKKTKQNNAANTVLIKLKKTKQNNAVISKGWNMLHVLPFNEDGYWFYLKKYLTIIEENGYELE